jgi:hypothetical protein
MACGLYDMDRKPRPVAVEYQRLIREFAGITVLAHGEMFELTEQAAIPPTV